MILHGQNEVVLNKPKHQGRKKVILYLIWRSLLFKWPIFLTLPIKGEATIWCVISGPQFKLFWKLCNYLIITNIWRLTSSMLFVIFKGRYFSYFSNSNKLLGCLNLKHQHHISLRCRWMWSDFLPFLCERKSCHMATIPAPPNSSSFMNTSPPPLNKKPKFIFLQLIIVD